eukprot:gnl/TRDRNA2_/TRDRNA2_138368_c0_seq1.p1 gnl/TRDRNA2_/TRDRNA2_138368_c0~~gnl/TRDRNA2_/TRDRNA2_138368_c0_seq1.p1  ORF type:complete len:190 (-),score=21.25 gnl/TRDRNA2_/TRDRNA2_138368_c0_seq1:43-612(-)
MLASAWASNSLMCRSAIPYKATHNVTSWSQAVARAHAVLASSCALSSQMCSYSAPAIATKEAAADSLAEVAKDHTRLASSCAMNSPARHTTAGANAANITASHRCTVASAQATFASSCVLNLSMQRCPAQVSDESTCKPTDSPSDANAQNKLASSRGLKVASSCPANGDVLTADDAPADSLICFINAML